MRAPARQCAVARATARTGCGGDAAGGACLLRQHVLRVRQLPRRRVRMPERLGLRDREVLQRRLLPVGQRRLLRGQVLLSRIVLQRRQLLHNRDLLWRDHVLQRQRLHERRVRRSTRM